MRSTSPVVVSASEAASWATKSLVAALAALRPSLPSLKEHKISQDITHVEIKRNRSNQIGLAVIAQWSMDPPVQTILQPQVLIPSYLRYENKQKRPGFAHI